MNQLTLFIKEWKHLLNEKKKWKILRFLPQEKTHNISPRHSLYLSNIMQYMGHYNELDINKAVFIETFIYLKLNYFINFSGF